VLQLTQREDIGNLILRVLVDKEEAAEDVVFSQRILREASVQKSKSSAMSSHSVVFAEREKILILEILHSYYCN